MKQRQLTHNDLPWAVESLLEKMEKLEAMLSIKEQHEIENRLPDIIDVKEVAKLLGLTTSGIYTKVHKNEIPFIKMKDSNRLRFSRKQINAWLMDSQKQAA
jgi:excisionase family DNA binding protein